MCYENYFRCSIGIPMAIWMGRKKICAIYILIVILRLYFYKMGANKSEEFSVKDNNIAKYARALSHPARVAILRLLIQKNACICGDIVDELPLSQSTVSQHLKELKAAGLIQGDIDGAKVCYCIDEKEWKAAKEKLNLLFDSSEMKKKCC
ncbi:MAG TPA: metalloregulator ArsR/SmtB family transcription factor [Hanamia sp.]|nr:metalloregulator ArsR/SmtB family transcription factor [Hanamia sp.]